MILILKTGSAPATINAVYGDFENWITAIMQLNEAECCIHSVGNYDTLPPNQDYSGIIITGSPLMVTDLDLKESKICKWLLDMQRNGTAILGICFGHQLLCVLNGGSVGNNISGIKIGSAKTYLTKFAKHDKLLGALPSVFEVYKSHRQSLLQLPLSSEILAMDDCGIIDAVKFGINYWGLQFHPEFNGSITRFYLQEKYNTLSAEGIDVQDLLKNVVDVDYGEIILKRFKEIAMSNR